MIAKILIMETKFILHGGFANQLNSENDNFFQEILKDSPDNPKILLIYFARLNPEKESNIPAQFEKNKGVKDLSFEIVDEKIFPEQIKRSDVIYLHGGKTSKLLNILKQFPNLENLFKGKIIAGESAGVYVLSAYFYSKSEGGVFEGLGFVPVKTICHYIGENREKLDEYGLDLETLLLPDFRYKVFRLNA